MSFELSIETIVICIFAYFLNKIYTDYHKRQNWHLFFESINSVSNYSTLLKNIFDIGRQSDIEMKIDKLSKLLKVDRIDPPIDQPIDQPINGLDINSNNSRN